jgi:hypothetical protein
MTWKLHWLSKCDVHATLNAAKANTNIEWPKSLGSSLWIPKKIEHFVYDVREIWR